MMFIFQHKVKDLIDGWVEKRFYNRDFTIVCRVVGERYLRYPHFIMEINLLLPRNDDEALIWIDDVD